jgi:2Fe-2S ferredoxin
MHMCIGQMIARLESECILGAIAARAKRIEPTGEPRTAGQHAAHARIPAAARDSGLTPDATMPRATYVSSDGTSTAVDVVDGTTLMRAAEANALKASLRTAAANMSCATCHIFVDPAFVDRLPPPSDTEDSMLDFTARPGSRTVD